MKSIQTYREMAQTAISEPERVPPYVRRATKKSIQGPLRHRAERKAINGKPRQRTLMDDLRRDDYLLVVLDACRYDVFRDVAWDYLSGGLAAAASEGYDTFEYIRLCWPDYYPETSYVSGATPVSSKEMFEFEARGLEELYEGYVPAEHIPGIVDVWDHGWSTSLGTCPPEAVLSDALDRLDEKRLVAHFFQPHAPYIGEQQALGHSNDGSATPGDGEPVDAPIWRRVREGPMSDERLREVYRSNLERALASVSRLVGELRDRGDDRRVVVMGDHGEALGEYGVYSHPRESHPKIRVVPWMEVGDVTDRGREAAKTVELDDGGDGDGDVTGRLQSLGYI